MSFRSVLAAVVAVGVASAFVACGGDSSATSSGPGDEPDRPLTGPQGAVGQFVVECGWSHSAFDDPIVHPGHEGASHRHEFFGNTTTAASSTYADLVDADTTCRQRLDTASYWVPSLLDGEGHPVAPLGSTAYYRAGPGIDPESVEVYPAGMMIVAGDAGADRAQPTSVVAWACGSGGRREPDPLRCAAGVGTRLLVTFPDCWDGRRTDSDDHRAHVAYSSEGRCSARHPVPIPQLQFAVDYPPIDPDGLSLASGSVHTAHADFWNAWDQDKLTTEVELCVRRQHVCGLG